MVNWSLIVDVAGTSASVLLTLFLVLLYKKQTDLNRYEMNRDARKLHTDVLRERIQYWLGEGENKPLRQPRELGLNHTRLPSVGRTDVDPAPPENDLYAGFNPDFRVIPEEIYGDRYLRDFLENHGEDVNDLRKEIHTLYDRFDAEREKFTQDCPEVETFQKASYRLEPIEDSYEQWLFERVILLERGFYDEQELLSTTESGVTQTTGQAGMGFVAFRGTTSDRSPIVYQCNLETIDLKEYGERDLDEEVEPLVVQALTTAIEQVQDDNVYRFGQEAASVLDEMAEKIDELEHRLIVYEGRPLYTGNCQYLQEDRVE